MKNWKLGSTILVVILSIVVWVVSGMLFSNINKWINYPIAIIALIVGLIYVNKHYGTKNS